MKEGRLTSIAVNASAVDTGEDMGPRLRMSQAFLETLEPEWVGHLSYEVVSETEAELSAL